MVAELGDVKQVVGDAAHDLAHLGVGVVGVAQLLQMGKGVPAHIGLDVGAHDVADARHIIVGGGVDEPQHQIQSA